VFAATLSGMDLVDARELEHHVRDACVALDPDAVPLPEAVAIYESLARTEKLIAGARVRLTRKLEEAGTAGARGERSAADVIARVNGTNGRTARDELDTSKRLAGQPQLDAALANGELSTEQANAISDAAGADPRAERDLLDAAKRERVKDLKDRCSKVKANAHPDPDARRKAIHAGRFARCWTDREGGRNIHLRGLPEDLAPIEADAAKHRHAAFDDARRAGRHEHPDAYAYDGFLGLLRGASAGGEAPKGARRAETKVFVHVDLDTLLRGRVAPGSICDIDGVGPVDLDWVAATLGTRFVVALLEREGTIHDVIHLGRQATALQRSYLEALGWRCARPGCGATHGLEIDHVDDWARTRHTTIDALALFCGHDHDLKTHHGYRLTGPPGDRIWWGPDGQVLSRDRDGPPPAAAPTPAAAAPPEPAATLFA
jgi:hypothetical protein